MPYADARVDPSPSGWCWAAPSPRGTTASTCSGRVRPSWPPSATLPRHFSTRGGRSVEHMRYLRVRHATRCPC